MNLVGIKISYSISSLVFLLVTIMLSAYCSEFAIAADNADYSQFGTVVKTEDISTFMY